MPPVLRKISVTQLRERLGEFLDRADLSRETFVITRGSRAKGVILSPGSYLHLVETIEALQTGKRPPADEGGTDGKVLTKDQLKSLIR